MNKEFIPYEQALELKGLGFEEPCFGAWAESELFIPEKQNPSVQSLSNNQCLSPLYQQVFRFFREKYCLVGVAQYFIEGYYCYTVNDMKNTEKSNRLFTEFETYEEAEHACLLKLIELAKQK